MSHVIGHRRYARETYPTSPGAGGAAAIVPLSRQRFIDGGTTAPGPGAAIAPFATIANFIASRPVGVSAQDSVANYVGWLMPALNGYTEDVHFPPYVSTELRADAFSLAAAGGGGTVVIGNMIWANSAGSDPGAAAFLVLHNISCTGDLTVTDDVGAPQSAVIFTGDENGAASVSIGSFTSDLTTKLTEAFFFNTTIRNALNAGASSNNASVVCQGCSIQGDISGRTIAAVECSISCNTITSFSDTTLFRSTFGIGTTPSLRSPSAIFDGSSWQSFLEAGGTRFVGTVVLVNGGANGALVEGAPLPATGSVSVSLNGMGATAGYTDENCGNHYSTPTPITGDLTVTLKTGGGELVGDTMLITKSDLSAHNLIVHNNAGGQIATVPSSSRGFVLARYNGSDWVFAEGGSLAA